MAEITLQTVVRRADQIVFTQLEQEVVLMNANTGEYFTLNPTGAAIWNHLSDHTTPADLCEELTQHYEIDTETCQQEVLTFLNDMAKHKAIVLD